MTPNHLARDDQGVSPVLATLFMVALTVTLAALVHVPLDLVPDATPVPPPCGHNHVPLPTRYHDCESRHTAHQACLQANATHLHVWPDTHNPHSWSCARTAPPTVWPEDTPPARTPPNGTEAACRYGICIHTPTTPP